MDTVYEKIGAKGHRLFKAWRACFDGGPATAFSASAGKPGRFANPAAFLIDECVSDVLAWLATSGDEVDIPPALADWCRLRAVQETDPLRALRPLLDLKQVIRNAAGPSADSGELAELEERIDVLGRYASERYVEYRERLDQVRLEEMQRGEGFMSRRLARGRARHEGEAE